MELNKAILDVLSVDLFADEQSHHSLSDRLNKRIYMARIGNDSFVVNQDIEEAEVGVEVEGIINDDDTFTVVYPNMKTKAKKIHKIGDYFLIVPDTKIKISDWEKIFASVTAFDDFQDIIDMPFGVKGYVPVYVSEIIRGRKKRVSAIVQTRKQQHEIMIEGAMPINSVWQKIELDMQPQKAYMLLCESNHMYEDGYRIVELKEMNK